MYLFPSQFSSGLGFCALMKLCYRIATGFFAGLLWDERRASDSHSILHWCWRKCSYQRCCYAVWTSHWNLVYESSGRFQRSLPESENLQWSLERMGYASRDRYDIVLWWCLPLLGRYFLLGCLERYQFSWVYCSLIIVHCSFMLQDICMGNTVYFLFFFSFLSLSHQLISCLFNVANLINHYITLH